MSNNPVPVRHPNLEQLTNRKIVIETLEGSIQAGVVTTIQYQTVTVLGVETKTPMRLIFNNDPSDFADWTLIKSVSLPVKAA
jgi:hypothetical protein